MQAPKMAEQDARRSVSGGVPACGVRRETRRGFGFGLQEAFGSRRCGVKRRQGGSRSQRRDKSPVWNTARKGLKARLFTQKIK